VKPSSWFHPVTWERVKSDRIQKSGSNRRIQASTNQIITIATGDLCPVRILSQESSGATFKIAKELKTASKKTPTFWIFESSFIQDLPLDPGEWHWKTSPPHRDAPFYGYTAKRGYINARNSARIPHMISFIQGLSLRNTSTQQTIARIWHNSHPRKVGTLIWLTLN
jgi:hypothetical protein